MNKSERSNSSSACFRYQVYPSYLKMQGCWLLSATAPRLWLPASPYLLYPYSRALLYLLHPCSRRQLLLRCSTSCIHAVVTHPNHLLLVGSWGFAQLPPTCISNSNGYSSVVLQFFIQNLPYRVFLVPGAFRRFALFQRFPVLPA